MSSCLDKMESRGGKWNLVDGRFMAAQLFVGKAQPLKVKSIMVFNKYTIINRNSYGKEQWTTKNST